MELFHVVGGVDWECPSLLRFLFSSVVSSSRVAVGREEERTADNLEDLHVFASECDSIVFTCRLIEKEFRFSSLVFCFTRLGEPATLTNLS